MLSVTSYTKVGLRLATIFGSVCCAISMVVAVIYLVMKLMYWDRFAAGMAPLLIGMCFFGLGPDLFYRFGGRVYPGHQQQGHEASSGH